ncbi:hypothetical protein GCM10017044_19660 [Kordiimonas sediminis]|uniref:Peptidase M1 membrane alanine aminopeptidase domain-containing protein n=1 Tax=Kordiimonas sediminis TaxID=1735581 RepID=A0A919ASM4_9PROT|nr:M1 family aminopeptidase [Kordiimonas sediminis]GHF24963.1 hypothetical protein GCM10017044_19660 [Kordiimonas sediminis]
MQVLKTLSVAIGLLWSLPLPALWAMESDWLSVEQDLRENVDYYYVGDVKIMPQTGHLKATWRIGMEHAENGTVSFMLRETLQVTSVQGAGVKGFVTTPLNDENRLQRIDVDLSVQDGGSGSFIEIEYAGVLLPTPMENGINHIGTDYIELNVDSFWFPIDARFNKLLKARFFVSAGDGWDAISTGTVTKSGNRLLVDNEDPFLDIAVTMAPSFTVIEGDGYSFYDLRKNGGSLDVLSRAVEDCYGFLNERFGVHSKLTGARFILHDRPESGYARKKYIALSSVEKSRPESLTGFVCHELAHYWSSYGKFDTVENWLNESFAVYAELMAVRHVFGVETYKATLRRYKEQIEGKSLPSVWTANDQSRRPYLVNYRKGPLALARLEQYLGQDAFLSFISNYMTGKVRTTPELLAILEKIGGKNARDWFEVELGK